MRDSVELGRAAYASAMRSDRQPDGQELTFLEQARRKQFVDCTIDAIADLGLPRASLAEIARRAGVSKAAILYHFDSRDRLIDAVIDAVLDEGAEHMASRIQAAETPAGELRAYIESNIDYIASHPRQVAALVAITMNITDDRVHSQPRPDASVPGQSLAPLQDILRRGQDVGEFAAFDTRTMAMTIRAAIDAIGPQLNIQLHARWAPEPDFDLADYTRELVALFDRATRSSAG